MDYAKQEYILAHVFGRKDLMTREELKSSEKLIAISEELTKPMKEQLLCLFDNGPMHAGDALSTATNAALIDFGLVAKVVLRGVMGHNACTNQGAWVRHCILASRVYDAQMFALKFAPGKSAHEANADRFFERVTKGEQHDPQ